MSEGERWQETFDLQLRLLRAIEQHRIVSLLGLVEHEGWAYAEKQRVFRDAEEALRIAAPVFVSRNIVELWDASWTGFKAEEFRPSDPFVTAGFALLPKGVPLIRDAHPIHALAWAPADGMGHAVWGLSPTPSLDFSKKEGVKISGRVYGPEKAREMLEDSGFFQWVLTGFFLLKWNRTDSQEWCRALQAFWRLGREFVRGQERIPRASRREGHRAGLEQEHVTVLRLRRTASKPPTEEPQPVDWRCQWVVRGHWRNQWFPSEQRHKQRYIAPYVKGPEDKPLRVTERVVEFVR